MQTFNTSQLSIIDSSNLKSKEAVARQVFSLYEETFASYGSEFEPIENIAGRLQNNSLPVNPYQPETYLLAYIGEEPAAVTGGIIFEYYRDSGCGLMTYIFTRDKGKGLGEFLIGEGLDWMLNQQLKLSLRAVFFETENPLFYKSEEEQLKVIKKRLKFFKSKAQAKLVDIPYVQPSLSGGQERVYSLLLMTLPKFSAGAFSVLMDKEIIKSFLLEFYNELLVAATLENREEPCSGLRNFQEDPDLQRISLSLDIADLAENMDPFGVLDHPGARKLRNLNQKIWQDFCQSHNRDGAKEKVLVYEKELQEILKSCRLKPDNTFFLREIPSFISPEIAIKRCSVAFHLVEPAESEKQITYCPFFHSYEKDLFSQRFQGLNSPYHSGCQEKGKVEVSFLNMLEFTSEGRHEKIVLTDPEKGTIPEEMHYYTKTLEFFLNYSYFSSSKTTVWELVFTPEKGNFLHEYEIIQLSKYFAGRQEKYKPHLHFSRLNPEDGQVTQADRIFGFLSRDSEQGRPAGEPGRPQENEFSPELKAGSVQIETSQCYFITPGGLQKVGSSSFNEKINGVFKQEVITDNFWPFFYKSIRNFHSAQDDKHHFEYSFKAVEELETLLSAFCGFCTGIFDFKRLEYEEITDTMIPRLTSATDSSFIIMNRGVMISFCHEDNLYESVRENIGMSPYLLIPNSVLAHNTVVAEKAENEIIAERKISNRKEKFFQRAFSFGLRATYKRKSSLLTLIEKKISLDLVPNVFQYPTENDLYEYGMEKRGVNAIVQEVEKKKNSLSQELERISKIQSDLFELRITLLVVILTVLQIVEIFGIKKEGTGFKFAVVILSLMAVFYFYYRKYTSRV